MLLHRFTPVIAVMMNSHRLARKSVPTLCCVKPYGADQFPLDRCTAEAMNGAEPLARQRKSQITRYFTTQTLNYHKLKSDSKDYK